MLPPVPKTPLQLINVIAACLYAKYLGVSTKCTDLCCRGVEEDSCKILPVVNILMNFEQLFSCGFRYFFSSRINTNAVLSDFDL